MFTFEEIKNILKQYTIKDSTKLEVRKKDGNTVLPENLSEEEKEKIISAIFLFRVIRDVQGNPFQKNKSEQEILDEIQSEFPQQILSSNSKDISGFTVMAGKPLDYIMCKLAEPKGKMNYMAEAYLQHTLAEKGKKAINIQRDTKAGINYTISYDIANLEKENNFKKQLDPSNPIYTQPLKAPALTPEQKANRRAYVEQMIQYYNMMEPDEYYQRRVATENKDMQKVANIVNNNLQMPLVKNGPGLFYLLKAAQNLTLSEGTDYLEEILSRPEVNRALIDFKHSEYAQTMKSEALENKKNGNITKSGHKIGHSLTIGEIDRTAANEYLSKSQQPLESINNAKKYKSIRSKANDKSALSLDEKSKLSLVRVGMRQEGKMPGEIIFENGKVSFEENESSIERY